MKFRWFYSHLGEKVIGPCTSRQMKALASTGQLLPFDRVRKQGMSGTVAAITVKGLFIQPSGGLETVTP